MKLAAYGIVLSASVIAAGEVFPATPAWLQGGGLLALVFVVYTLLNKTIPAMLKSHEEERRELLEYLKSQRKREKGDG